MGQPHRTLTRIGVGVCLLVYLSFSFPLGSASPWHVFSPHVVSRPGVDFLQVPRGAYALFRGRSISGGGGTMEDWAPGQPSNYNAYPPIFTVIVGGVLQSMPPPTAQWVWHAVKVLTTLLAFALLARGRTTHRFFLLATALYFCNVEHFHEIQILQYQSIANALLVLFLIADCEGREVAASISLIAALLVKPFALLFPAIPLLRNRNMRRPLYVGLAITAATVPFLFFPQYRYFFHYLKTRLLGPPEVETTLAGLQPLLIHSGVAGLALTVIKVGSLALILLLACLKRASAFSLYFFLTVYWLSFEAGVYEYHFTALIAFFACGVLLVPAWQTFRARALMVWATLPSPYIVFSLAGWGLRPNGEMDYPAWTWYIAWKFAPLFLLIAELIATEWRRPIPAGHRAPSPQVSQPWGRSFGRRGA